MTAALNKVIIGTRGSQLALWQAEWVKKELMRFHPKRQIEIEIINTTGDKILDSPLSKIGDKGLFTKEIELALLDHHIDLAVHSLKDVPTNLPQGLTLAAITKREDVRDVFISHPHKNYKKFSDVPVKAKIATGSLRRKCQALNWRQDLEIIDLRGNLNTRFAKLDSSEWDGMILAYAGVTRLGFQNRITEILPFDIMLPAIGQGALGIEIREQDEKLKDFLQPIASEATTYATSGERAFLHALEGGCQIPIGAFARIEKNMFTMDALIGSLDGKKILRGSIKGNPDEAENLGIQLAKTLAESGGKEILDQIRNFNYSE